MGLLFGTGIDTRSPTFAPLTDDAQILRQWIELMLDTRVGVYWSAPECGCSLRGYILRGMTPQQLAGIPAEVRAALKEDERIADVDVTARQTFTGGGGAAIRLVITVTTRGAEGTPFQFTAIASADRVLVTIGGA